MVQLLDTFGQGSFGLTAVVQGPYGVLYGFKGFMWLFRVYGNWAVPYSPKPLILNPEPFILNHKP